MFAIVYIFFFLCKSCLQFARVNFVYSRIQHFRYVFSQQIKSTLGHDEFNLLLSCWNNCSKKKLPWGQHIFFQNTNIYLKINCAFSHMEPTHAIPLMLLCIIIQTGFCSRWYLPGWSLSSLTHRKTFIYLFICLPKSNPRCEHIWPQGQKK